ncbi:unnamed protein product [Allacma fusca]|uniref:Tetraspanin n=1 Tax=Allacma fusca TaxID=39272 RepID=A0A8J2NY35_9HEXA|nr:unnamed protein product [Allacma fusca]
MVSIFKTSCFIFWLIWMSTLSFLFGIRYIQSRYSYLEIEETSGTLMTVACIATIVMAILGCCCVKFDVMHICCAAWYIGLTFFGIVIVCVLVMNSLKSSTSGTIVNEVDLLQKIIKEYKSSKTISYFLYHTQLTFKCCGIVGFKDYRAFILKNSTRQDVPYSCCRQPVLDSHGHALCTDIDTGKRTSLTDIYLTYPPTPEYLPKNYKAGSNILTKYYGANYLTAEPEQFQDVNLKLPVNETKAKSFYITGCYEHLRANSQNLHDTYFEFCLVLMAASVLMAILFIRNCLKARRLRKDRMKEMIEGSVSATEAPKASTSGEFSEEEQQQILHELTNVTSTITGQYYPPGPNFVTPRSLGELRGFLHSCLAANHLKEINCDLQRNRL